MALSIEEIEQLFATRGGEQYAGAAKASGVATPPLAHFLVRARRSSLTVSA